MDERISRFKHCDPRLHSHLDKVFSRLPGDLRDEILNNEGFQILADGELPDICGRCFDFDRPVEKLVYLNPRALMQPERRLLCSIAWEIADYVAQTEGRGGDNRRIQELLVGWGFDKEVKAMCFCDAIAGSKAFKSGYEWARNQSEDYLMLHFGLYFDEWDVKGLSWMPDDQLEELRTKASPSRLLPGAAREEEKDLPEGVSAEEVFIEGVLSAIKEIKLKEH